MILGVDLEVEGGSRTAGPVLKVDLIGALKHGSGPKALIDIH